VEGLISIIVILYLVTSVIGAVLKRIQRGPILDEPTIPSGRGKQQTRQPEEAVGKPRDVVVIGLPHLPSEGQYPTVGEGQLVEVMEESKESGSDVAEMPAEEMAEKPETFTEESWVSKPKDRDRYEPYHARPRHPVMEARGQIGTKSRSPYWVATASEWRRAVVLAEVLGKPRGLEPFRPGGRR
jgi:hypothetical protein